MGIDARRVRITTAPATEPINVEEMKLHLRVDHSEEDVQIEAQIVAARVYCEGVARRSFVTRTYTATLDTWPYMTRFELPYPPLLSVEEITYTDLDGNTATYDAANYLVDKHSEPGRIALKSTAVYPSVQLAEVNAISIVYTAGYGDMSLVPEHYKAAIKLLVAHWHENREAVTVAQGISVTPTPLGLDTLLLFDRGGW